MSDGHGTLELATLGVILAAIIVPISSIAILKSLRGFSKATD